MIAAINSMNEHGKNFNYKTKYSVGRAALSENDLE
jgi:hypothetical protein